MVYVYIGLTFILLLKLELGYTVPTAPTVPVFSGNESIPECKECILAELNVPVNVECFVKGGTEPVVLNMFKDGKMISNAKKSITRQTGENIYYARHRYLPSTMDFDAVFTCTVKNPAFRVEVDKSAPLYIRVPPRSIMVTEVNKMNKHNGDTALTLKCSVDESNPKSFINWKGVKDIPRTVVKKENTHVQTRGWTISEIWMLNLTRKHNGHNITCEVKNQAFPDLELIQIYRLYITYYPVITISGPGNRVAYLGDDVLLTCNVDSNPPSTLAWHNQTDLIKETHGTNSLGLHIANISLNHSRMYTCTAHNNIGGTKTRSVSLTVKEKTFPKAVTGSSSISTVVPAVVGCTIVVAAAVIVFIVFVTYLKRRQNAQVEIKETKQRSSDPGRNGNGMFQQSEPTDTNDANKASAKHEDGANDQREYESVDPVEREERNEREETKVYSELDYDDVNVNLNTGAGTKCVRAKLDLKQASDNNDKSRSKVPLQPTNVTLYVNTDQQQYESVLPTTERKDTHTYSKLGGDDGKTNLQSQGDVSLVLAELDLKRNSDNAARKPLLVRDEPNNESHYVNAKQPVYEGLEQKVDMEETHYSKLATD